jgi:hypothetical protein
MLHMILHLRDEKPVLELSREPVTENNLYFYTSNISYHPIGNYKSIWNIPVYTTAEIKSWMTDNLVHKPYSEVVYES